MLKNLTKSLLCILAMALPSLAQDNASEAYSAQTANADVDMSTLKKAIKPLTQEEMLVEADAWMALLVAKNKQIAAAADADVTALTLEQTALVSRLTTVTEALTARGGDATKFDQYVAASTTPELANVGGMFDRFLAGGRQGHEHHRLGDHRLHRILRLQDIGRAGV